MASTVYPKGRQGFVDGSIDWDTGDVRAMLVRSTYVYDGTDQFVSDLGAVDNGRTGALTSKTVTDGVLDAADTQLTAIAAVACNAIVVFQHTGNDATARLICYIDGRVRVQVAAAAAGGATTITVEDLPDGIANGATLTLVSGSGPATITTTASAVTGARSLSVSALSGALSVDAVYEYAGTASVGLPFTPAASQQVNINWDNGPNRIAVP